MRGAFWFARPPGRMTSVSSGMGAASTAAQSGGGTSGRPRPPQPAKGRGPADAPCDAGADGYAAVSEAKAASAFVSALF